MQHDEQHPPLRRPLAIPIRHDVTSPYQPGPTQIRVLCPSPSPSPGTPGEGRGEGPLPYPVVYLLPVEPGDGTQWGDAMLQVQKAALHDRHRAIVVYPTFSQLPWYADHPPVFFQETHLLKFVIPFVEAHYPARPDAGGRLLVGFSKSGWGAYSLLLRHPDLFAKAAAWDAPLMMDAPGDYGSGEIFGTAENFAAYRVATLLRSRAAQLGAGPRLALLGYSNFRAHHQRAHALMDELKIDHLYRDGPLRPHDWVGGWLPEAFEFVC